MEAYFAIELTIKLNVYGTISIDSIALVLFIFYPASAQQSDRIVTSVIAITKERGRSCFVVVVLGELLRILENNNGAK